MKENKIKKFECKPKCIRQYLDIVVISCEDCLKHVAHPLSKKQKDKIVKILLNEK